MTGRIITILFIFITVACSTIDKDSPISNIEFEQTGKNKSNRPEMYSVCKGFILSRQQVIDFYLNAETIRSEDQKVNYDILPCYSSGTAYMYGTMYRWTILYGGIGVFTNDNDTIIKVCGKNCCNKVQGIC